MATNFLQINKLAKLITSLLLIRIKLSYYLNYYIKILNFNLFFLHLLKHQVKKHQNIHHLQAFQSQS